MAASIIITALVLLLFAAVALRCAGAWGFAPAVKVPFLIKNESRLGEPTEKKTVVKVFFTALFIRAAVFAAMIACLMIQSRASSISDCLPQLELWDVRHYINLAEKGYADYVENGEHLFLVFFPLYVWLTSLFRLVIPNTFIAGTVLSCLCFAGGCCYVYKLTNELYDGITAENAVIFLSVFPFSFFFGTVMTESLFLLTTAAAVYYAFRRKWLLFGVFGALAAMTRMTGVLVIIPAGLILLEDEKPLAPHVGKNLKKTALKLLKTLPCLLMPISGTVTYLVLNLVVDGNAFAFITHQQHWFQGSKWVSEVVKYLFRYLAADPWGANSFALWLPELLLFILTLAMLFLAARDEKNSPALLFYGAVYFIVNYSLSWLLSAGRYLSCGFMLFIFEARLTRDRPMLRAALIASQCAFFGIYLLSYINGAQIM